MENQSCWKCGEQRCVVKRTHRDYYVCKDCLDHITPVETEGCCKNPNLKIVKFKISNGGLRLTRQCYSCWECNHKLGLKLKDYNVSVLPWRDKEKQLLFRDLRYKELDDLRTKVEEKRKQGVNDKYHQYLNSDQWRIKRRHVLERDNHLCQSCLNATATQAHHITYAHIYNEPLFDLIAVCKPCHDSLHAQERKEEYTPITHESIF